MSEKLYAEEAPRWTTNVDPDASMMRIRRALRKFGVRDVQFTEGELESRRAWVIQFKYNDERYLLKFIARECQDPDRVTSFRGHKRTHREQAYYQMARVAEAFTEAILMAAVENEDVLLSFKALPTNVAGIRPDGLPWTVGDIGRCDLSSGKLALPQALMGDNRELEIEGMK
jgi:hypothetical protein